MSPEPFPSQPALYRFDLCMDLSSSYDGLKPLEEDSPGATNSAGQTDVGEETKQEDKGDDSKLAAIVYGSLAEEERDSLKLLVQKVADLSTKPSARRHLHPFTLVRFLRARDGKVADAEKMFRNSMDWRAEFELDRKALEWAKELEEGISARSKLIKAKWMIMCGICADIHGNPVTISRIGRGDPGGIERECGFEIFLLQHVLDLESCFRSAREYCLRTGEFIGSPCVEIVDMHSGRIPNYTSRGWNCVTAFKKLAPILEANYPDRLRRIFIINVPWIFKVFWKIFTPLIPKETRKKISLHPSNWMDAMSEFIPRDNIPADIACNGGKIPPEIEDDVQPCGGLVPKGALEALYPDLY